MEFCRNAVQDRHFIENWSVEECCVFIEEAGFPQYKGTFLFNKVSGADLFLLESRHLPNLGIRNYVEIKQIMAFLKDLRQQENDRKLLDFREEEAKNERIRRIEAEVRHYLN